MRKKQETKRRAISTSKTTGGRPVSGVGGGPSDVTGRPSLPRTFVPPDGPKDDTSPGNGASGGGRGRPVRPGGGAPPNDGGTTGSGNWGPPSLPKKPKTPSLPGKPKVGMPFPGRPAPSLPGKPKIGTQFPNKPTGPGIQLPKKPKPRGR